MLSEVGPSHVVGSSRRRVARALFWPTVRVARLDRVAGTVLLGSIPLLVTVLRDGTDLTVPTTILGIVTGASIGWIADDPTADLLTPCPVNTPRRLAARVLLASVTACTVACAVIVVAALVGLPTPTWTERVPELLFSATVALSVGFSVMRRGDPLGGVTGVTAGALLPVFIAALAFRWPDTVPSYGPGPSHNRWWLLMMIGALVAAHSGSDPATTFKFRPALEVR